MEEKRAAWYSTHDAVVTEGAVDDDPQSMGFSEETNVSQERH